MILAETWKSIQNDSMEAFHKFFDEQWKRCFSISYNLLRDKEQAEDLVQEVFMDLWIRRKTLMIQNPEAFLTQMIKNKAFITLSRTSIPVRNLELLENLHKVLSPEETYLHEELHLQINHIVDKLPDRCREVFILRRYDELSVNEIATKLGMSIRTVEHHLYQATKLLKSNLNPVMLLLIINWLI
ncbi:RNA polymerase sigma factor [Pontibacter silvestris]|uniref:RNA polymerase sigma factor n=1 Tax=Pontibacter silvestris TaxID=2305183 RepID=A0ABW4X006_9BACT|nr:RNA polymerase sigma-70 factor [Pontibacter silvestris]MCC9137564.1 RNA polymerase sigma-70 factor [Pontibacter silvestris]